MSPAPAHYCGAGRVDVRSREIVIGSNLPPWYTRLKQYAGACCSACVRRALGWQGAWWIVGVAAVLALGVGLSWAYWGDLEDTNEPVSTTIRNLALIVGGVAAMLIALWRSHVAAQQSQTAQEGLETARQSLLNERFQQGAEMLGSEFPTVRLGGIYALSRLAARHVEEYHLQVMELLCAFARNPTLDRSAQPDQDEVESGEPPLLREDVQAVASSIRDRSDESIAIEDMHFFTLDLHGADLRRANLYSAHLAGANLKDANLGHATLVAADLSGAILEGAKLRQANITLTKLPRVGLTQEQLDQTRADPPHAPRIPDGALDAETGEPLAWGSRAP